MFRWLLGSLYLVFALLQANDPDPFAWISIYILAAFCAFTLSGRTTPRVVALGVTLVATGWAAWLLANLSRVSIENRVEVYREVGGLALIVIGICMILFFTQRRKTGL